MSSRNSLASCAARVLLCASTRVGPLHLLDEPGRGRRLAGTGRAEQHDVGLAGVDAARRARRSPAAGRRSAVYSLTTSKGGRRAWVPCLKSREHHRHRGRVCALGGTARSAVCRLRSAVSRSQSTSVCSSVCSSGAVGVDHDVGDGQALLVGRLRPDAPLGLRRVHPPQLDQPLGCASRRRRGRRRPGRTDRRWPTRPAAGRRRRRRHPGRLGRSLLETRGRRARARRGA